MKKKNELPTNMELAETLRDIAAVYHVLDEDKYRFQKIAYERAADGIEKLSSEVKDYYDENKLTDIPGVGRSIAEHLKDLYSTGKSNHFRSMLRKLPKAVFTLMKVSGIGPKKAFRLVSEFDIPEKDSLKVLLNLAQSGKIAELEGFGEESQKDIIQAVNEYLIKPPERTLLSTATEISEQLTNWLKDVKGVVAVTALGSLRRSASTVGDIDMSVSSKNSKAVFDRLVEYPGILRVMERGEHSCSILLPSNIQVDVMVQPPEAYGSLLQHFTGSKHHNVALREYALKQGMSLSEYGIKPTRGQKIKAVGSKFNKTLGLYQFSQEEQFYNALGLDWIPPELREEGGEIEAGLKHSLPNLLELSDLKGDLQMHTDFDIETSHDVGASSMEDMALRAIELGYEYVAFTEHNPSQKGHTERRTMALLKKKREAVNELNEKLGKKFRGKAFKVFNSLEVDILPTGNLAISDNSLEVLDFALVSLHSVFNQERKVATKRVLEALSHPNVRIFAHPTGRLLNRRESINLDWEQIFDFALTHNKWIEINADPNRLDLPDMLVRDAVKKGVKLTLGTDSHHLDALMNMKYGVSVARRGWATRDDIINTRTLKEFQKLLR